MSTLAILRQYRSKKTIYKSRECLLCGNMFSSYGPQNRMCKECRKVEKPVMPIYNRVNWVEACGIAKSAVTHRPND